MSAPGPASPPEPPPASVRRAMLLRSLAVQGSWNYDTMIGAGLAFVLLPALRRTCAGDDERLRDAVRRHAGFFNSHPYLATVAAGAVARLEADGADPALVERFKGAVRGSLGSLGDRVVWLIWRPACALLGVALLLAGAAWWVATAAFLVAYNALHLWLRAWGLRTGWANGLQVARVIRESPLERLADRAADAGAALAGLAAVLMVGAGGGGVPLWAGGAAAVAAGVWLGAKARRASAAILALALAAGLAWAGTH